MTRKVLHVTLDVRERSEIELTLAERVQLDRLVRTPRGPVGERLGALLHPGVTTLVLDRGQYFFTTLSDSRWRVVSGGVEIRQERMECGLGACGHQAASRP
jgi:hypothetical protein